MPRRYRSFDDDDYGWPPYVSVGERRRKAERHAAKLDDASPVIVKGSRIVNTFWGRSWCHSLERYGDYANRLPRGRTYVRSGCVVDLKIASGIVTALVSGSRLYDVEVHIHPMPAKKWKALCSEVAGSIDSLVELAQGAFPNATMEALCRQQTGLFPAPTEIKFTCSCPDSARMCKHISAVLYGVGARLDEKPELLFTLRKVDQEDLIADAGSRIVKPKAAKVLETENLSEIFGIDIVEDRRKRRKK